jgi:hypothetical protein
MNSDNLIIIINNLCAEIACERPRDLRRQQAASTRDEDKGIMEEHVTKQAEHWLLK